MLKNSTTTKQLTFLLAFSLATLATLSPNLVTANEQSDAQNPIIRGEGKQLEMLVRGRVLNSDGSPASAVEVSAEVRLKSKQTTQPVQSTKHKFEVWVPIGWGDRFSQSLKLTAKTKDREQRAFKTITAVNLRQAAIDGVVLQLTKPPRLLNITVTKNDTPVPNANVIAATFGPQIHRAVTNKEGIATFHLLNNEVPRTLSAWTDDHEIGGFLFNRAPYPDPFALSYTVELTNCRDQVIRFLNAVDGSPVSEVPFKLTPGTGPPNYNFVATPNSFPHFNMRTNKQGEAVCRWFPDWTHHRTYVELPDSPWKAANDNTLKTSDDGSLVLKIKPRIARKRLTGKVNSSDSGVAGLMIQIQSFQGEEENHSDLINTFTNADGSFQADCIPGATYCICVNDAQLCSNIIDLIPYDTDTGETRVAELTAVRGQPVEIHLTAGPDRKPIPNQWLNVRENHDYSWYENGRIEHGGGGRSLGAFTDSQGIARTVGTAGSELEVSVYAGEWRSADNMVKVRSKGVTKLNIHREFLTDREVTGQLIAPSNSNADLANAEISFRSTSNDIAQNETIKTDGKGRFAIRTKAATIAMFAYTADGKAAGTLMPEELSAPLEFHLQKTATLSGQVTGEFDETLADYTISAEVLGRDSRQRGIVFSTNQFERQFVTKTDSRGNYTMKSLPSGIEISLRASPSDESFEAVYLDNVFLNSENDNLPVQSRLDTRNRTDQESLQQKYDRAINVAKLGNFHTLAIMFDSASRKLVEESILDRNKTKELSSFINLRIRNRDARTENADEFFDSKNWSRPEPGIIFLYALDTEGSELGSAMLETRSTSVKEDATEFIRKHAPSPADAELNWDTAMITAEQSDRKVWAYVGRRYSGASFKLWKWFDDNRSILNQDYVLLKINDENDIDGQTIARRITGSEAEFTAPFHAMFDANEERLIDSQGPTGNIGYPLTPEARHHLRTMLMQTRKHLTNAQIQQLIETLE